MGQKEQLGWRAQVEEEHTVGAVLFSQCPGRPREDVSNSPPQLQLPPSMPMDFLAPRLVLPRRKRHHARRERHQPRREHHPLPKMHLAWAMSTAEAAEVAEAAEEAEGCLLVRQGFPCLTSSSFFFSFEKVSQKMDFL